MKYTTYRKECDIKLINNVPFIIYVINAIVIYIH